MPIIVKCRYENIEPIPSGEGGFGRTYLANYTGYLDVPSQVVLKEIKIHHDSSQARDSNYLQDLRSEADTLKTLNHDQIPQYYGCFEQGEYFYIVQEYIQGEPLNNRIPGDAIQEPEVIIMMREMLDILKFVHNNGIIHRDIKPANLIIRERDNRLVLIDFGAVKEVATQHNDPSGVTLTRAVGTPHYMPAEQHKGCPQFCSDIYAVGIIAIQALTGRNISEFSSCEYGNIQWQQDANLVNQKLRDIVSKMTRYLPANRYQSAEEVLAALKELDIMSTSDIDDNDHQSISVTEVLNQPSSKTPSNTNDDDNPPPHRPPPIKKIVIAAGVILSLGLVSKLLPTPVTSFLYPACDKKLGDYISCGEEILYPHSKGIDRIKGAKYLAHDDYHRALYYFKRSWDTERKEAETLIYMNNALLEASGFDYYTLAVAFPLSYKEVKAINYELSQELLRGVAQAQTEVNQNLIASNKESKSSLPGASFLDKKVIDRKATKGLKIVIVDDRNSSEHTEQVAHEILKKSEILGLIGHYASKITLADVDIYEENNLAEISPSSTTIELTENPRQNFFRSVYNNAEEAQAVIDAIQKLAIQDKKIAVYYNPSSDYSKNFWLEISQGLNKEDIKLIKDIGDDNFSTKLALEEAKKENVNLFILLPDGQISDSLARAKEIIEIDDGNTPIVSGNVLVNSKIEQIKTSEPLNLIAASNWHHLDDPDGEFTKNSRQLWGTNVNGVTVLAYDATLSFIEAIRLQKTPTRKGTIAELRAPGFSFIGASGKVKFNTPKNGDRLDFKPTLVRLFSCEDKNVFIPTAIDNSEAADLACS